MAQMSKRSIRLTTRKKNHYGEGLFSWWKPEELMSLSNSKVAWTKHCRIYYVGFSYLGMRWSNRLWPFPFWSNFWDSRITFKKGHFLACLTANFLPESLWHFLPQREAFAEIQRGGILKTPSRFFMAISCRCSIVKFPEYWMGVLH